MPVTWRMRRSTRDYSVGRAERAIGQRAIRRHRQLRRFARRARGDLRSGAGRSVRCSRRRQLHQRGWAGEPRIRRRGSRHQDHRRARPYGLRRGRRDDRCRQERYRAARSSAEPDQCDQAGRRGRHGGQARRPAGRGDRRRTRGSTPNTRRPPTPILSDLQKAGKLKTTSGVYDIATGEVDLRLSAPSAARLRRRAGQRIGDCPGGAIAIVRLFGATA